MRVTVLDNIYIAFREIMCLEALTEALTGNNHYVDLYRTFMMQCSARLVFPEEKIRLVCMPSVMH